MTEPTPRPPALWSGLALGLALVALAIDGLGVFPPEVVSTSGALLLPALFRVLDGSPRGRHALRVTLGWLVVLLAMVLWLQEPRLLRLAALALVLAAGSHGARAGARENVLVLARVLGVAALWFTLYRGVPFVFEWTQDVCLFLSSLLAGAFGSSRALGADAFGLPALVVLVTALVSLLIGAEGPRRTVLLRTLLTLFLLHLAYLVTTPWLGQTLVRPWFATSVAELSTAWILFAAGTAVLALNARSLSLAPAKQAASPRAWPAFAVLAASVAIGAVLVRRPVEAAPLQGNVLLYDRGYTAWDLPSFRAFGLRSTGMFGLLPVYMESKGLNPVRSVELTPDSLRDMDIVVLINIQEKLSRDEREALWDHVDRGGGLLVLGDHTGLAGIREPFNELLEPVSIEFNFDCAKPAFETWEQQLNLFPSSLALGIRGTDQLPYGVGASLTVAAPGRVALGSLASWSDRGDLSRESEGYIGDFTYEPGESLGGLSLVATASRGDGRVLVFGDTSTFQNGSFASGELFADNCVRWLLRQDDFATASRVGALSGLALLAIAVLLFGLGGRTSLAWSSLAVLPFVWFAPWERPVSVHRRLPQQWRAATIDLGHGQQTDDMWWRSSSIGGLHTNLLRNELWTCTTRDIGSSLNSTDMVVVIPPGREYSSEELKRLNAFVRDGGVLLATLGYDSDSSGLELAQSLGFVIGSTPLGPAQPEALGAPILFRCAYPILSSPPGFVSLATAFGYDIAGWSPMGAGAVVLIADSQFLRNGNFEGRDTYVPENVTFFQSLVSMLREEDVL